jgi:hypothetical protein
MGRRGECGLNEVQHRGRLSGDGLRSASAVRRWRRDDLETGSKIQSEILVRQVRSSTLNILS